MSTSLAVSFAVASFLISWTSAAAQVQRHVSTSGVVLSRQWRVDLRPIVVENPLGLVVGRGKETQGKPYTSIVFTDNETIAVTFVVRAEEARLTSRDGPTTNSSLRLRAIFLGAGDGKVKAKMDWPTQARYAAIIAGQDGTFVTQRGRVLTRYSAEMKELSDLKLPTTESVDWQAHSSPTGRSLLFVPSGLTTSMVPWLWVDGTSLQIVRSWEDLHSGWLSITDSEIAMTKCVWVHECEPGIEVRGLATDWNTVLTLGPKVKPRPVFLDHDTLFLLANPTSLIRINGQVIFSERNSHGGCWWAEAVLSKAGGRFVVPSCKLAGAVRALDLQGTEVFDEILLYDVPYQSSPLALYLPKPWDKDLTTLALSPDGLRLAILNNEVVEMIQLPPVQ